MLPRRPLAVLACLSILAGAAHAQGDGGAQKGAEQKKNPQAEQPVTPPPQPVIRSPSSEAKPAEQAPPKSKVYQPDCDSPRDHDQADLCAQRKMAKVAEDTYHLTLAQVAIGTLGLIAIIITLGFTARANKATSIAAQAAVDAVNAERAWMSPENIDITLSSNVIVDDLERGPAFMFQARWYNGGRSPAIRANIFIDIKFMPYDSEAPHFEVEILPGSGIVGPGLRSNSIRLPIYGDNYRKFLDQDLSVFVYSRIWYAITAHKDILVYTESCTEIKKNGIVTRRDGQASPNIEQRLVGPQNDAI
ncbi:MAG: hypothetical protein WAP03_00915 [Methylorubrum rhodinum]